MPTLKSLTSTGRVLTIFNHSATSAYLTVGDGSGSFMGANINVDGPALRDALLEMFPVEDDKPAQPSEIDTTPGMVLRGKYTGYLWTIVGDGTESYCHESGLIDKLRAPWPVGNFDVVFDPRDATALPNPFGIRVGDTVKRTKTVEGVTETVEFEVSHISESGVLTPRYGASYNPSGFEVVSREVPTRLPAGAIVRHKKVRSLWLRTEDGYVYLEDGYVEDGFGTELDSDVRSGIFEVIYLP